MIIIFFFWTHGAQRNKRKFGWVVVLFFQQVFKTLEISRKFWFFLTWLFFRWQYRFAIVAGKIFLITEKFSCQITKTQFFFQKWRQFFFQIISFLLLMAAIQMMFFKEALGEIVCVQRSIQGTQSTIKKSVFLLISY